jgi:uncharacterized protein (TIRG00374 family)
VKPGLAKAARAAVVLTIVVALVLFGRGVQWGDTWRAIRSASPTLLGAAAIINLLSLAIKGVRWWIFLRPVGVPSLGLAMRATFAGSALNNVLIANGGEAARVVFVARTAHVPSAKVLATLALERLFDVVGYVVLLALAVTVLQLPPPLDRTRPYAFVALFAAIVLLVYLVRHPEKAELPVLEGEGLLHRARSYGRRFIRTLTSLSTGPRFAGAMGISVLVFGLQIWTYHLTARAAHFDIPWSGTVAALLAVNLGFVVRVTPGNVGVFQMMYAMTAAGFGMDKDLATGVAFLLQTQQMLPVILIGLIAAPRMLFERRRTSPRDDNILPGEPPPAGSVS